MCRECPIKKRKPRNYYYAIIGPNTGHIIGACVGEQGRRDVLHEEPCANFRRVTKWFYEHIKANYYE